MGCNCGGSTPRTPPEVLQRQQAGVAREDAHMAQPPVLRQGGPGQPGYVWNGPQTPENTPDAPDQPDQA